MPQARCFFALLVVPLSYNFKGHFKNTYPPLIQNFDPWRLWDHFFLTWKPFFNLHLGWAMMQVNVENAFNNISQIVIKRSTRCHETFSKHCPLYQVVLWCSFFFLLPTWTTWKGITIIESSLGTRRGDPLGGILCALAHYKTFLETITRAPSCVFPSLVNNTHIMGPVSEVVFAFDHLSTQLALVGLRVKM